MSDVDTVYDAAPSRMFDRRESGSRVLRIKQVLQCKNGLRCVGSFFQILSLGTGDSK